MAKKIRVALRLELESPYKNHTGIFAGIQQYAREHGWQLAVDEFVEDTLIRKNAIPYDGIIARASTLLAQRAEQRKIPVVNVMTNSPAWRRVPSVLADFSFAGRLCAEHLLSRGLRCFAALVVENQRADDLLLTAFTETLAAEGCSCISTKVPSNSESSAREWRKMERTISSWMQSWEFPIGVLISTEALGRIVTQNCLNRDWRVPEDVAIIAGLNELTLCEGLRPTLTSIEIGYERIGYEATRQLDHLIHGKEHNQEPILIQPLGLVVRESTDFIAVDDEIIAAALKFIASNCHREISTSDVANAVFTEIRTLQRRFLKYLNRSIIAEIRRVRIERAKRELEQSNRTLTEIARRAGFGNPLRMYVIFRQELGLTPNQYRRERKFSKK